MILLTFTLRISKEYKPLLIERGPLTFTQKLLVSLKKWPPHKELSYSGIGEAAPLQPLLKDVSAKYVLIYYETK